MATEAHTGSYNPDVLSCLANLSSDEVFTPPDVANQMLDMLPPELFRDPRTTFLDPACKSGVFLREIAKRLNDGLEEAIPDRQERIDHIYRRQLYGIAITEITSLLSRRSLYCSKYPNGIYSVTKFEDVQGNIRFQRTQHRWKDGRCIFCGAAQSQYDRGAALEAHAYQWIHTGRPEEILGMKFDVIVGNPPYQLSDGGQKAAATPLYQLFVQQAMKLSPRYLTMVVPARWYSGGRGLGAFREAMLGDRRVRVLVDYTDSSDLFPGVDIAGGICYFLWDSSYDGECHVTNHLSGTKAEAIRALDEPRPFIRYNKAIPIIKKVGTFGEPTYDQRVSSQKPFGLRTYVKPETGGELTLRYGGGTGPYPRSLVTSGLEWIDKWKVITSRLTYDHAGRPAGDGRRRIISTLEVLPPGTVCTETYLVIDAFENEERAKNLLLYLTTSFVRFLVAQVALTQQLPKSSFAFVPIQDFSRSWTDEELYAKYGLSEEEVTFIESMISPMDSGGEDDG